MSRTRQPKLGYRYASFSGGTTKAFDPLFTGLPEWGSWFHFMLDDADQEFGLAPARVDHDLADESDLILDLALTNWWSITATFAVAWPNQGFREAVDGSDSWFNGYLYMNFNF